MRSEKRFGIGKKVLRLEKRLEIGKKRFGIGKKGPIQSLKKSCICERYIFVICASQKRDNSFKMNGTIYLVKIGFQVRILVNTNVSGN